jgi:DNA-binding response OmpR family regulator
MRGFELGAADYIIKPIRRKELLLSRILNALKKREI